MRVRIGALVLILSLCAQAKPWPDDFLNDLKKRNDIESLGHTSRTAFCKAQFESEFLALGAKRVFEHSEFQPVMRRLTGGYEVTTPPKAFVDPSTGKSASLRWIFRATGGNPSEVSLELSGLPATGEPPKSAADLLASILLTLSYDEIPTKTEIASHYTAPVQSQGWKLPPREVKGRLPRSLANPQSQASTAPPPASLKSTGSRCLDPKGHFDFQAPSGWNVKPIRREFCLPTFWTGRMKRYPSAS